MHKQNLHVAAMSALLFFFMFSSHLNAFEPIFPPTNPVVVFLQVHYVDPNLNKERPQRTPVQVPEILIADHTLLFNTSCDGCILRLLNITGDVEYSIVIPANTTFLELPLSLEGEFEIQIIRDNLYFYGDIYFDSME